MNIVFEVITTIRNMRSELEIPPQDKIEARVFVSNKAKSNFLESSASHIKHLSGLSSMVFREEYRHTPGEFVTVLGDLHIVIPLFGVIDAEGHKAKSEQRIQKAELEIKAKKETLSNTNFIKRAPPEIVAKEKQKLEELKETLKKLKVIKDGLS